MECIRSIRFTCNGWCTSLTKWNHSISRSAERWLCDPSPFSLSIRLTYTARYPKLSFNKCHRFSRRRMLQEINIDTCREGHLVSRSSRGSEGKICGRNSSTDAWPSGQTKRSLIRWKMPIRMRKERILFQLVGIVVIAVAMGFGGCNRILSIHTAARGKQQD
jgi:hypothetical protein